MREGRIDAATASLFARLQKFQAEADYTAELVFTTATATDEVTSARKFVKAARALLEESGWLA